MYEVRRWFPCVCSFCRYNHWTQLSIGFSWTSTDASCVLCKLHELPALRTSDCQWRSQHISSTSNHVVCSSAAALCSCILWVSLDLSQSLLHSDDLIIHHKTFSSFNRCEVWNVDTARICDCAARSTSLHHLSGLLFSEHLADTLDQTTWRKRTGVDWWWTCWTTLILQRFTEKQI